jgi:hypothetical protein
MNDTLPPSVRRVPSPLDVQILDTVRGGGAASEISADVSHAGLLINDPQDRSGAHASSPTANLDMRVDSTSRVIVTPNGGSAGVADTFDNPSPGTLPTPRVILDAGETSAGRVSADQPPRTRTFTLVRDPRLHWHGRFQFGARHRGLFGGPHPGSARPIVRRAEQNAVDVTPVIRTPDTPYVHCRALGPTIPAAWTTSFVNSHDPFRVLRVRRLN